MWAGDSGSVWTRTREGGKEEGKEGERERGRERMMRMEAQEGRM